MASEVGNYKKSWDDWQPRTEAEETGKIKLVSEDAGTRRFLRLIIFGKVKKVGDLRQATARGRRGC